MKIKSSQPKLIQTRTSQKASSHKDPNLLPFDLLNETALLRTMLTQIGDELIITTADGRIVYANDAAERNFGISKKSLLNKKIMAFYRHKISPSQWHREFFSRLKASRQPEKFVIERLGRYHKTYTFEVTAVYCKYNATELLLSVGRDITDKVSLQNKLVESELRYRQLSERASEGIILLGFDGTIFIINKAVEHILADNEQNIVNSSIYEYLVPDSKPKLRTLINRIRGGSQENFDELEIITSKGDRCFVEVLLSTTMARYKKRADCVNCIIRDISRKKQVQTLLQESEKMKALQNFISGTAQEIQYPIHGLQEKISDVIERYRDRDFEYIGYREFKDLIRTLEMMRDQARTCCDTADRLLSINKKKVGFQKDCADVNAIIYDLVKKFDNDLKFQDIKIRYAMDNALPLIAIGEVECGQVIYHVFLNALQSMVKGGAIAIRTRLLTKEQIVQIEVRDTGAGIPRDVLPHVFEPFFTTKKTGYEKNTGLGLSIVHSIVHHFKGEIFIKSDLHRGTTVVIEFPVYKNNPKKHRS